MRADEALRRCDIIEMETASGCMIHKAKLNELGVLIWVDTSNPVSLATVLDGVWQRHHPEPKCPACIKADTAERWDETDLVQAVNKLYAEHLRGFHCTCKGD